MKISYWVWAAVMCFGLPAQDWIDPFPRPVEENAAESGPKKEQRQERAIKAHRNTSENSQRERECRRPPPMDDDGDRPPPRPPDRAEVFNRLDVNGDGVISREEFMNGPLPPPPPPFPPPFAPMPPEDFFKQLDSDGDGSLSLDEFRKAPRPPPPPGIRADQLPEPDEMFERLDSDGDGKLSLAEFKRGRLPAPPARGEGRQQRPARPPKQTQEKVKDEF